MNVATLVNGRYTDNISVYDRGLAYGDGVFETIRIEHGVAHYLDEHLQRLQKGCGALGLRCDNHQVVSNIDRLLTDHPEITDFATLKITVTREPSGRSYRSNPYTGTNCYLSLYQDTNHHQHKARDGVSVVVCDIRLPINPRLAGIKHLCRLENVLAANEYCSDEIAEGLLLDTQGRLIEGTMSNVFLVSNRHLYTPALHRCGVEGVIRHKILADWAARLNIRVEVCDLRLDDLLNADELFLCNSLIGIWPIKAVGCHRKNIGDITRRIQDIFNSPLCES